MEWIGSVLVQTVKDFFQDSGPQWAAAIAYYSLLSLFPLLLAAASLAAYFIDPEWAIQQATTLLGAYLPGGSEQIRKIITGAIDQRQGVGIISLLALLWSGSRVFGVTVKALNIAYDVDESYSFFRRLLIEQVMTISIGLLFVLALASRLAINLTWQYAGDRLPFSATVFDIARTTVPSVLLVVTFFLAYLFVPRRRVDWKAALTGALAAMALFSAARPLFINYVNQFANYNLIYGPLAIVIILVLWAWITAAILLLGGELVSHLQDMWVEKKSQAEVDRRHKDRSPLKTVSTD